MALRPTTLSHRSFFNKKGELKHISSLRFWALQEVLHEKYHFAREDADSIAAFLKPLLEFQPPRRATAAQCLENEWLQPGAVDVE